MAPQVVSPVQLPRQPKGSDIKTREQVLNEFKLGGGFDAMRKQAMREFEQSGTKQLLLSRIEAVLTDWTNRKGPIPLKHLSLYVEQALRELDRQELIINARRDVQHKFLRSHEEQLDQRLAAILDDLPLHSNHLPKTAPFPSTLPGHAFSSQTPSQPLQGLAAAGTPSPGNAVPPKPKRDILKMIEEAAKSMPSPKAAPQKSMDAPQADSKKAELPLWQKQAKEAVSRAVKEAAQETGTSKEGRPGAQSSASKADADKDSPAPIKEESPFSEHSQVQTEVEVGPAASRQRRKKTKAPAPTPDPARSSLRKSQRGSTSKPKTASAKPADLNSTRRSARVYLAHAGEREEAFNLAEAHVAASQVEGSSPLTSQAGSDEESETPAAKTEEEEPSKAEQEEPSPTVDEAAPMDIDAKEKPDTTQPDAIQTISPHQNTFEKSDTDSLSSLSSSESEDDASDDGIKDKSTEEEDKKEAAALQAPGPGNGKVPSRKRRFDDLSTETLEARTCEHCGNVFAQRWSKTRHVRDGICRRW